MAGKEFRPAQFDFEEMLRRAFCIKIEIEAFRNCLGDRAINSDLHIFGQAGRYEIALIVDDDHFSHERQLSVYGKLRQIRIRRSEVRIRSGDRNGKSLKFFEVAESRRSSFGQADKYQKDRAT